MLVSYKNKNDDYAKGGAREVNWKLRRAVPALESICETLATTVDRAINDTEAGTITAGLI
jgi:hypothetical protein